jgi:hypothetical protein
MFLQPAQLHAAYSFVSAMRTQCKLIVAEHVQACRL